MNSVSPRRVIAAAILRLFAAGRAGAKDHLSAIPTGRWQTENARGSGQAPLLASPISQVFGSVVPIQTIASRDPLTKPFGFSDCISGAQHGITIPGEGKHSAKPASDARANFELCWTNRSDIIRSVLVVFPLNHPSTPAIAFRSERLGYSGPVGRLVFSEFGGHRSNFKPEI